MKKPITIVIKSGLASVMMLSLLLYPASAVEDKKTAQSVLGAEESVEAKALAPAPEFLNVSTTPELTAKSSLAYDLRSGAILYADNFDEPVPIASLTKIMVALIIAENIDLNKIAVVQKPDIEVIGTNMGLVAGERIKIIDLVRGMLIPSSNDATRVLARAISGSEANFVDVMNAKAWSLGMTATKFYNTTGLDIDLPNSKNNTSTAHDLGLLVNEFIKNETLSEIVNTKEMQVKSVDERFTHDLRSTNKLLFENSNVTGLKTGYTSLAKGNLIVRQTEEDSEIIAIVLGLDNREEDAKRLLEWVRAVYKW